MAERRTPKAGTLGSSVEAGRAVQKVKEPARNNRANPALHQEEVLMPFMGTAWQSIFWGTEPHHLNLNV